MAMMPRRTLLVLTAGVLALHWLALAGVPLQSHTPLGTPVPVFSTRTLAAPPPQPLPPPAPTAPVAALSPVPAPAPKPPPPSPQKTRRSGASSGRANVHRCDRQRRTGQPLGRYGRADGRSGSTNASASANARRLGNAISN